MKITVVGTGYVGLVSGVCLADIGHHVTCVDIDKKKISLLQDGVSPIYEPGLEELIRANKEHQRIFFSTDLKESLNKSEIVFIAVGTPSDAEGKADLSYVKAAACEIGENLEKDILVIIKSTVPVGTGDNLEKLIRDKIKKRGLNLEVLLASNPEFLKEGTAIADFMKPDRIVLGLSGTKAKKLVKTLYKPFTLNDPSRLLIVERRSSEMIKYASNAMLATRISFMNEVSRLCEKTGACVEQVRLGMGKDPRIGPQFLYAGPGFGGSCFPKDVRALLQLAKENDSSLQILDSVLKANKRQKEFCSEKIKAYFPSLKDKKIAVWGLSFKPGTDDVREAPAKEIIQDLLSAGAKVIAHDPKAKESFKANFSKDQNLTYCDKSYDCLKGANALVLMTEWREYLWPNWQVVSSLLLEKIVFDFRNQYVKEDLEEIGIKYFSIGRS